mmetsp:Transcript_1362/g.1516  ORF Transcript_1362/g.1516 Transcript_1362/m.1516 type:complete len:407 (-) Transcript_1362:83-1303(-)
MQTALTYFRTKASQYKKNARKLGKAKLTNKLCKRLHRIFKTQMASISEATAEKVDTELRSEFIKSRKVTRFKIAMTNKTELYGAELRNLAKELVPYFCDWKDEIAKLVDSFRADLTKIERRNRKILGTIFSDKLREKAEGKIEQAFSEVCRDLDKDTATKVKAKYKCILAETLKQVKKMFINDLGYSDRKTAKFLEDMNDRLFEVACSHLASLKQSLLQRLNEKFADRFQFDVSKIEGPEMPETYNVLLKELHSVALSVYELTLASLQSFDEYMMEFVQTKCFLFFDQHEFDVLVGDMEAYAQSQLKKKALELFEKKIANEEWWRKFKIGAGIATFAGGLALGGGGAYMLIVRTLASTVARVGAVGAVGMVAGASAQTYYSYSVIRQYSDQTTTETKEEQIDIIQI